MPGVLTSDQRPTQPSRPPGRSGRRHFGNRRRFGRRCTIGRPGEGEKSAGSQRVGSGSSRRVPGSSGRNLMTSRKASALSFVTSPAAASSRNASRSASIVSPVAACRSLTNDAPYDRSTSTVFVAASLSAAFAAGCCLPPASGEASDGASHRDAVPRSTKRSPVSARASLRSVEPASPIQTTAPLCVSVLSAVASYGLTRDGR